MEKSLHDPVIEQKLDADYQLSRAGKTPVLKRNFGFFSILGLGCIVLSVWEAAYFTFQIGYTNGGPSGVAYGLLIALAGTLGSFVSLAELASMAPVAAGQYHWISMLAPASSHKLLSYITGWLTVLGWQATIAAVTFACAELIQTFIELVHPSYTPHLWHTTLLYYALVAVAIFVNIGASSLLPIIDTIYLVLYLVGFIVVLITFTVLAPSHASAKTVFTTFLDQGGWGSQGLSFMIGFVGVAWSFTGADVIYHMSEEIHDAARVVPRTIMLAITINGCAGFATILGILFCIPNPDTILQSTYTYPFAELFLQSTGSVAGAGVLMWIVTILQIGVVLGIFTSSSRMLWSFARDQGLPGWQWLSQVNPRTTIPQNAILASGVFALLIGLISVGSDVAFNDLVSLSLAALYGSYFMACAGLFYRRITGAIKEPPSQDTGARYNLPGCGGGLVWGPWRVPGILGVIVNGWACVYLAVVFFFTFWPTVTPVNGTTMSYCVVVFGLVAIISALYYFVSARKTYKGPIIDELE